MKFFCCVLIYFEVIDSIIESAAVSSTSKYHMYGMIQAISNQVEYRQQYVNVKTRKPKRKREQPESSGSICAFHRKLHVSTKGAIIIQQ